MSPVVNFTLATCDTRPQYRLWPFVKKFLKRLVQIWPLSEWCSIRLHMQVLLKFKTVLQISCVTLVSQFVNMHGSVQGHKAELLSTLHRKLAF